jgi:hypothetical protein
LGGGAAGGGLTGAAGGAGPAAGTAGGVGLESAAGGASNSVYGDIVNQATTPTQAAQSTPSAGAMTNGPTLQNAKALDSQKSWGSTVLDAMKDYSKGSNGTMGDAIGNVKQGNYTQAAGYAANKIQSMNPGSAPTPLIQLPQGQQQQRDPMEKYRQLYSQYRSQVNG